jgi:hypothetical protein
VELLLLLLLNEEEVVKKKSARRERIQKIHYSTEATVKSTVEVELNYVN